MEIMIDQPISMADRRIGISITHLPPGGRLTLRALMHYPWAESVVFGSSTEFVADDNGCVDLTRDAPVSGDYTGVDGMGFFSSMRHMSGKLSAAFDNVSIGNSIFIEITAECGAETVKAKIERRFLSPDTKVERITEPFVGEFYYSEEHTNKTVLMWGGSGGGLASVLPVASLLSGHGFNVLALAYFGVSGLPKELVRIPLEYFDPVFDWLASNTYTKDNDLYLHCTSKGSELGLILASTHPVVKKVAAFAPHAYCFQGTSFTKYASSWTHHNQELPYIRYQFRTLYGDILGCFIKNKPFGYTHTHVMALNRANNKDEARIKVENIKADLLMFSGKQCNMWNTYDGCIEIMDTLNRVGYPYGFEHIDYENAGEPWYAPYIIPESIRLSVKIAPRLSLSMGGTLQGNTDAVIDSWERMLAFFS